MSKQAKYWKSLSQRVKSPGETKNKRPDTSAIEMSFLEKYLENTTWVLDLGAGTGILTNKIAPLVHHVTAVEYFTGFSDFIEEVDNVLVINANLVGFLMRKKFDVVLMTGVAQCFAEEDARGIYVNAAKMVRPGGCLIARTHCGLTEDIKVDGWSDELQTNYFASYRQVDKEEEMIKAAGLSKVTRHDFLPDSLNVWPNSRHFYFTCSH